MVVAAGLSIDILRRNRRNPNPTTLHFGLAITCVALGTALYGLPVLWTHDALLLNIATFAADVLIAAALLFLWFITSRAFLPTRPRRALALNIFAGILTAICMIEAIPRNLTAPYSMQLVQQPSGQLAVLYTASPFSQFINTLDAFVLVFIGIYFFKQSSLPPAKSQRIRLRGVSVSFIFAAVAFLATPALPISNQRMFSVIMFSIGFIAMAVAGIISLWMAPKERQQAALGRLKP